MLARSFSVPGDHVGQASTGYRWPFGPVAIVSPFNFPLGEQPSNEGTSMYQGLVAGPVDSVVMAHLCIGVLDPVDGVDSSSIRRVIFLRMGCVWPRVHTRVGGGSLHMCAQLGRTSLLGPFPSMGSQTLLGFKSEIDGFARYPGA